MPLPGTLRTRRRVLRGKHHHFSRLARTSGVRQLLTSPSGGGHGRPAANHAAKASRLCLRFMCGVSGIRHSPEGNGDAPSRGQIPCNRDCPCECAIPFRRFAFAQTLNVQSACNSCAIPEGFMSVSFLRFLFRQPTDRASDVCCSGFCSRPFRGQVLRLSMLLESPWRGLRGC